MEAHAGGWRGLNAAAAGVLSGTAVVIILISEVIVGSPA
jgi:hypothetical protein